MKRRIIDIHNHPNWHGVDIDALVANMDEHGIEKTWLLSWEISDVEFQACAYYHGVMDPRGRCAPLWMVVEGLRRHPGRFIGGWAPDPRDRYTRAKLQAAARIHGIRVYGELKCRMRYDNPDALATYRYCGELGLPVLFHLEGHRARLEQQSKSPNEWPEWYGGEISVVDTMCRLCPQTQFIGHGPGFWREISAEADSSPEAYPAGKVAGGGRLPALLREHPNLWCDLSAGSGANALSRDLEHAASFVAEFQDRILFGRDYFDRQLLDVLDRLALSDDIMDKVLHANAEKMIERPAPPRNK